MPLRGRNLWEITILSLLQERPMHPYLLRRLAAARHKDYLEALPPGSLYTAVARLARDGLIRPVQRVRAGRHPERTVYEVTDAGRAEIGHWLRGALAAPAGAPQASVAAIDNLALLTSSEVRDLLAERVRRLQADLSELETTLSAASGAYEPVVLLELGYQRAVLAAELSWADGIRSDLASGHLSWDYGELVRRSADVVAALARPVPADAEAPTGGSA